LETDHSPALSIFRMKKVFLKTPFKKKTLLIQEAEKNPT
jgi:hypothetical protein